MRIAAIDQGTTSTRVLVVDSERGTADIACAIRHAQTHPAPGRVEQDPLELLANIRACLDAAGPVDAIGLANQGESCLAWHAATGEPLSPVIVWQDNRTAGAVAALALGGGQALIEERAGLPPDAYFSAGKLRWIIESIPAAREALTAGQLRLGTTDAFFLNRLTGRFVTDTATASRTSLMNLLTGAWDADLCDLFGVPAECLPEIGPAIGDFGAVDGVPVTASIVDQQAALYGHFCRAPGDAKITFGTGAFALAVTGDSPVRAPEQGLLPTVGWSSEAGITYAVDGGVYDAGSAVEWGRRIGLFTDLSELDAFDVPPAIDRDLAFVPALSGLACPHWDRSAAALFLGMSGATTQADLRQALLEGIALRTAEVIAAMHAHVPIGEVLPVDGGLSRSRYFVQFLADVSGRTIKVSDFDERTAFGAAALAAKHLGVELQAPATTAERVFAPRETGAAAGRRQRFAEAVKRSRLWRV